MIVRVLVGAASPVSAQRSTPTRHWLAAAVAHNREQRIRL